MKSEIDNDFYCSAGFYLHLKQDNETGYCAAIKGSCGKLCSAYHRKHPTPEQFKFEYGEEWNGAVYIKCGISNCTENCNNEWISYPSESEAIADMCTIGLEEADPLIVCACTPFGKPDVDWRPE